MGLFGKRNRVFLVLSVVLTFTGVTGSHAQQADMVTTMRQIVELAKAGRYADAIPLARKLVTEAEKASGPNSALTATALTTLGQALQQQGELAEAETVFVRLLKVREKAVGQNHPDLAVPLSSLAQIALTRNRLPAAEQYILRAIAIREQAPGADTLDAAIARVTLGNIRHRQARDGEALAIFERALKTFKTAGEPGRIMATVALNNIAEVHKFEGHLQLAEDNDREALSLQEQAYGPQSLYITPMLNNLGDLYRLQGRFEEAEALARRTLDIREKALGPEHADVAASLSNLAIVFSRQGRAPEAEGLLLRALAILEKTLGPYHPDVAAVLNNLADAIPARDRRQEAEAYLQRSLAIREKSLGPDHPSVAISLDNLVAMLAEEERFAEAEPLARRSLAIREAALGKSHPLFAISLNNLGFVLDGLGRHGDAGPLFQRALDIDIAALGENHPEVATDLDNLGWNAFDLEDWATALRFFNRAAAIWISRNRAAGESQQGSSSVEIRNNAGPFRGAIASAYRLLGQSEGRNAQDLKANAFEMAQRITDERAAGAISKMSARIAAGGGDLPQLARERQDLEQERMATDRALIAAASQTIDLRNLAAEKALRDKASVIADRLKGLDESIAARFPQYATLVTGNPIPLAEAQSQLAPDQALFLFSPARDFTFVWTITTAEVRWHAAPVGAAALAEKVEVLRCGLDASAWAGSHGPECASQLGGELLPGQPLPFDLARAHELFAALFGPVEDAIKGKELILVPSGPLATLPFQVLLTARPAVAIPLNVKDYAAAPWLAKRFASTVIPSVASLKAIRQFAKESHGTRPFIGFGNPLLDGDPANPGDRNRADLAKSLRQCSAVADALVLNDTLNGRSLAAGLTGGRADIRQLKRQLPLPETAIELCAVAASFMPDAGDVRLGAEATETGLKSLSASGQLSSYRTIHFATHGALSGEVQGSDEPGLILTPPDRGTPLDDGYLTASEISGLKLDADLVILSACNTAGGESEGAEAFSGLARAFFYAGTRALLVSHWAVDSGAAVKLIIGTVSAMQTDPSIGRSEALRRSMVELIEHAGSAAGHPAIWAPFVVAGEGSR